MYEQVLQQMRRAVETGRVRFTGHALDELEEDGLLVADALHCILTGEIVEDQYDQRYRQIKYVLYGDTLKGDEMGFNCALGSSTGRRSDYGLPLAH